MSNRHRPTRAPGKVVVPGAQSAQPVPTAPMERHTYRAPNGGARVVREPTSRPGTVLLTLSGEFDVDTASCLRAALADARRQEPATTLLDLGQVAFGDSSFLHALLSAGFLPRELVLIGPIPHHLRQLFLLTGSLGMFTVVPDRTHLGLD
ncbi:STAS domain-containing protein [Streptomyces sp. NPDC055103]